MTAVLRRMEADKTDQLCQGSGIDVNPDKPVEKIMGVSTDVENNSRFSRN